VSEGDECTPQSDDSEIAVIDPPPQIETVVPACTNGNQEGAPNTSDDGSDQGKHRPRNFLGRLSINEWLTFFVGLGSLVISYFTYQNAADTKDIKDAVSNLSTLATQTKRQADFTKGQLDQVRREADAVSGQLDEMKKQTGAFQKSAFAAEGQLAESRIERQPVISVAEPVITHTTFTSSNAQGAVQPTIWNVDIFAENNGALPPKTAVSAFAEIQLETNVSGVKVTYTQSPDDPGKFIGGKVPPRDVSRSGKVFGAHIAEKVATFSIPEFQLMGITRVGQTGIAYSPRKYFLYGAISYSDWLHKVPHLIKFCYVIKANVDNIIWGYAPPHVSTEQCRHWNCTDKQCEADAAGYQKDLVDATLPKTFPPIPSWPSN